MSFCSSDFLLCYFWDELRSDWSNYGPDLQTLGTVMPRFDLRGMTTPFGAADFSSNVSSVLASVVLVEQQLTCTDLELKMGHEGRRAYKVAQVFKHGAVVTFFYN